MNVGMKTPCRTNTTRKASFLISNRPRLVPVIAGIKSVAEFRGKESAESRIVTVAPVRGGFAPVRALDGSLLRRPVSPTAGGILFPFHNMPFAKETVCEFRPAGIRL